MRNKFQTSGPDDEQVDYSGISNEILAAPVPAPKPLAPVFVFVAKKVNVETDRKAA